MGYVAMLFLGCGLLGCVAGSVLLLIASFRRHIGWGLASLFVPGAAVVFAILHWSEAKRGFLLQIMGGVVLAVGILAANDDGTSRRDAKSSTAAPEGPGATEVALKAKEVEVRLAEQDLAELQAKLNVDYVVLKARRENLRADPAALAAFNQDAAAYDAAKMDLSVKAGRLAQLRADQLQLTDQVFLEAREKAKGSGKSGPFATQRSPSGPATPKPITVGPGDIVMYTTKHCPACLAAKQYLAGRGVRFKEVDVESSWDGRAEFDKLGGRSVPLILVKGQRIVGFDRAELERLL